MRRLMAALLVSVAIPGSGLADEDAPDVELIIGQPRHLSRPVPMTGRHRVHLERREYEGATWYVGCVPCYNAMTTFALKNGNLYALNGITRTWSKNYKAKVNRSIVRIREADYSFSPRDVNIISEAQSVPGCSIVRRAGVGITERIANAVTFGDCLNAP